MAWKQKSEITRSLEECVYGANGDMDEEEIQEYLIETIHQITDYQYAENGIAANHHSRQYRSSGIRGCGKGEGR
jgi:hypothetical protein